MHGSNQNFSENQTEKFSVAEQNCPQEIFCGEFSTKMELSGGTFAGGILRGRKIFILEFFLRKDFMVGVGEFPCII